MVTRVMFGATTAGARLVALGGSAVLHASVAVAVVAAGHASAGVSRVSLVSLVATPTEIVAPAIEPQAPLPEVAAPTPRSGDAHPTHTHPYPVSPSHDRTPHDPSLVHAPLPSIAAATDEAAVAPAVVTAPASAPPRFIMAVGPALTAPGGASVANGGNAPAADAEPLPESGVDTPARLVSGGVPPYPREALEAAIEADVPVEVVVDATGHVVSARALAHLGYGLDEAAERAVRAYRFEPARLRGRATAVRIRWPVLFRLR